MKIKQRVFSGIQPTGQITIGNYLGAIQHWLELQKKYDCFFCVADLHSLTLKLSPIELQKNISYNIALYIAAGLDPNKVTIFQQSSVSEHCELLWILSCFTQIGWLSRMTQFKDKKAQSKYNINLGLYSYPVLMAADILLYNADIIPVGEDQRQHVELTREIARFFNKKTSKNIFAVPSTVVNTHAKKIMSLKDASKKMSKSDSSDFSRINISDDELLVRKKIRKAKTDTSININDGATGNSEMQNLMNIYSCFSGISIHKVIQKFQSANNFEFKEALSDLIIKNICPIHEKATIIIKNKNYIQDIIREGMIKAKFVAKKNINIIKKIIGTA